MIIKAGLKSTTSLLIGSIIWLSIVPKGFGANILIVCPFFFKSITGFHVAIARSLRDAGHQITIVHPFPRDVASENLTVIDSSLPNQPVESNIYPINEALQITDVLKMLLLKRDLTERDCYNSIQLEEIQHILRSRKKKFDVMIIDLLEVMFECFWPIAEILDIPVIGTCATKLWWSCDWRISNPNNPAVIPNEISFWSPKMNFMQRLINSWYWIIDYLFDNLSIGPRLKVFYKKHFPNLVVTQRIKPSIIFTNSHEILIQRPNVPNVINIGGICEQSQPAKPLPQYLQKFIDEATDGVILFTFGSTVRMFEENSPELNIFKSAFAQIPQRVIWKMEKKVENLPNNVITSKWLPQRDILAHNNVIAFITHCGISGTFEAIYKAKPLVMIPIFYDQMSNSAILEDLGVGVSLDLKTLSVEKVLRAVNNVVQNTKYRKKMQTISKIVRNAPMTPEKAVVYWTEYVIRHKGAPHLRITAADMPLYEYLSLDIILFVCGVLLAIVYFSYWCSKRFLFKKSTSKKHVNPDSKLTK